MRKHHFILCIILTVALIAVTTQMVSGASRGTSPADTTFNSSSAPVNLLFQGETRATVIPRVTAIPPVRQSRRSGEVEHPITHPIQPISTVIPIRQTPAPLIRETPARTPVPAVPLVRETPEGTPASRTTSPTPLPTPTVQIPSPGTTPPVTPVPTSIIVTVTVPVYPSGGVYNPFYYYPPGYDYPINAYYPAGALTVTSNPPNAIVTLDGYNQETTPWIYTNLLPGYHTVEINYPGYEAYVTNVYVNDGENPEIDANLLPLVNYGSMFVESTPPGADVYVDGNYEGVSPVTVSALTEDPHIVEMHLSGYDVQMRTVDVVGGQGANVNFAMAAYTASTDVGSIDLTSNVPGTMVYLDGTYKGLVHDGNVFNVIAISPGSHTLLLHAPGFNDFTQTVQVDAAQVSSVNAVLTQSSQSLQNPAAPGQQAGSIVAQSIPSGGQVFLDNQFRGVAPVTIYNVAPGDHIVNMKLAGYSDWSGSVTVQPGLVAQIAAAFAPGTSGAAVPTRAGLPIVAIISAVAIGALIVATRVRK